MPPESGGVLFVHAHPDDECVGTGGSIARLVAEGKAVHLVVVGDGPDMPALHRLVESLAISRHVSVLGWREDLPEEIAALWAYVLAGEKN